MKAIFAALLSLSLSGCAYYLTPRPPITERKLGTFGSESVGALATAADYRVIFVKLKEDVELCAEAPADAIAQSAGAALLAAKAEKTADVQFSTEMAITMRQLFRRSQGVSYATNMSYIYCNALSNRYIDREGYLALMKQLAIDSVLLIQAEIPNMSKYEFDAANPANLTQKGTSTTPKEAAPTPQAQKPAEATDKPK